MTPGLPAGIAGSAAGSWTVRGAGGPRLIELRWVRASRASTFWTVSGESAAAIEFDVAAVEQQILDRTSADSRQAIKEMWAVTCTDVTLA